MRQESLWKQKFRESIGPELVARGVSVLEIYLSTRRKKTFVLESCEFVVGSNFLAANYEPWIDFQFFVQLFYSKQHHCA